MIRRRFERMARDSVKKYIESDTGRTYWVCNGVPTWSKPKCLGDSDVSAVTLASESRQVQVMCEICTSHVATSSCKTCNELDRVYLCGQCFHEYHQGHEYREIANCCKCELQIATRVCTSSCGDRFCDTCFHAIHSHGKMATHSWRSLLTMCQICDTFAAKGMCTNEEHVSRYACVPCSQLELERGGTNTWSDILVRPTYRDETEMEAERITETIKLSVRVAYDAAKFAEQTASYEAELAVQSARNVFANMEKKRRKKESMKETKRMIREINASSWEQCSTNEGDVYFYNLQTHHSTWTRPEAFENVIQELEKEDEKITSGVAGVWETCFDEVSGMEYYYNSQTGESTWENPLIS